MEHLFQQPIEQIDEEKEETLRVEEEKINLLDEEDFKEYKVSKNFLFLFCDSIKFSKSATFSLFNETETFLFSYPGPLQ